MSELYYPVEKIPVESLLPGYTMPSAISHAIVVTHPTQGKRIVSYCSEGYHLQRNEDIVPDFVESMSKYFDIEVRERVSHMARFNIDLLIKNKQMRVLKKDQIFPRITMTNSYDQSRKFGFIAGLYRVVCNNGLTVPASNQVKLISMHTQKLGLETNYDNIMGMVSEFLANSEELFEKYDDLLYQPVRNVEQRVEEVIEYTQFPRGLMEDVLARVNEEEKYLGATEMTDWLVYNAFNFHLNHNEGYQAKDQTKEKVDQDIFEYLTKY